MCLSNRSVDVSYWGRTRQVNPLDRLQDLENSENEDIQFLLGALKVMREIAIAYAMDEQMSADSSPEEIIDNQFEERICE